MKDIVLAFLAIYLATVVHGQTCCAPTQWEGTVHGKTKYKITEDEGERLSYDAENQRTAFSGVSEKHGGKFKAIYDFANGKSYFILPDEEKCDTKNLTGAFRPFCVPDNAMLKEPFCEDAPCVKEYTYPFKNDVLDVTSSFVVTDTCIPISFKVHGTYQNTQYSEFLDYSQITLGVEPGVFSLPEYCDEEHKCSESTTS